MNIYKVLSLAKDVKAVKEGKIKKRIENKIKGRVLNKVLNKVGFWSK